MNVTIVDFEIAAYYLPELGLILNVAFSVWDNMM